MSRHGLLNRVGNRTNLLRYMRHRSSLGRATNAVHILNGTPMFGQTDFSGSSTLPIDSFEAKGF